LGNFQRGFGAGKPVIAMADRARAAVVSSIPDAALADGCIVGSALQLHGDTWTALDPEPAQDFMDRVRAVRG
jgi:predicted TIM-barrel enzyme